MKLRIYKENYLNEDIEAVKKYYPNIDDSTFMDLISLDPTYRDGSNSLGKYGKWILNLFKNGKLSKEDFGEITPLLKQFTTYRNRIQNKDLNAYKTIDDLSNILASVVDDDSMLSDRQKLRFLKNVKAGRTKVSAEDDYDVVLDTPKFIVYVPNTHAASMKLGRGTEWCTAHENPEWYEKYTKNGGKLYIVKNKRNGKKWQYSDLKHEFLDQYDDKFDIVELLISDENLSKFFEKFFKTDFSKPYLYDPDEDDDLSYDTENMIRYASVKDGAKSIGYSAFNKFSKLEKVYIPDSVVNINEKAFANCEKLNAITIPNSVKKIGKLAFMGCLSLRKVTMSKNIERIDKGAFAMCMDLKKIEIPSSVTYLGDNIFYDCDGITVYTDSDYVIKYCTENNISVKPVSEYKNESFRKSFKLRIRE